MNNQGKELYEFGPFRLDPVKRLVLLDNQPVPLQLKAFETLLPTSLNSGPRRHCHSWPSLKMHA
jgi:DNA-binding response OmpR family regulator